MKEFKGTPGPWYRGGIDNGKLSINAGKYFVALVDQGLAQKSNASLISAAPDLLAALQLIISYHDDGNCELHSEDAAMARAAINKALGE